MRGCRVKAFCVLLEERHWHFPGAPACCPDSEQSEQRCLAPEYPSPDFQASAALTAPGALLWTQLLPLLLRLSLPTGNLVIGILSAFLGHFCGCLAWPTVRNRLFHHSSAPDMYSGLKNLGTCSLCLLGAFLGHSLQN